MNLFGADAAALYLGRQRGMSVLAAGVICVDGGFPLRWILLIRNRKDLNDSDLGVMEVCSRDSYAHGWGC